MVDYNSRAWKELLAFDLMGFFQKMAKGEKMERAVVEQELSMLIELTLRLEDELNNIEIRQEE